MKKQQLNDSITTSVPPPLIMLDCDPGHDDALAIMFLKGQEMLNRCKLLSISTVFGNQKIDKTHLNACRMAWAVGYDTSTLPMLRGASRPLLLRPGRIGAEGCPEIHGHSGLDLPGFGDWPRDAPNAPTAVAMAAAAAAGSSSTVHRMYTLIRCAYEEYDQKTTIVATGAYTNVALLLRAFPNVEEYLEEVVVMGGAIGAGNMSAAAEFNILEDAAAAQIVFSCETVRVRVVPLETTHTALITDAIAARLLAAAAVNARFQQLISSIITFYNDTYRQFFEFKLGGPLHDPLAVLAALQCNLFQWQTTRVDVDCSGGPSHGRTNFDLHKHLAEPKNPVYLSQKVDLETFWQRIIESIQQCASISPLKE